MIAQELVEQINQLAHKAKTSGLTSEEIELQAKLRRQYLDGIKAQMVASFDQLQQHKPHKHGCKCGCHSKGSH
ncbi:MAG: DUF896 domain-containing protein [Peptococcaceae bacterium]|nr:DUF896 domain-containing protein [Peptococcaceae bacterium]